MAGPYIKPEDYYNTVDVEDYYDKVHRTTWARRVAGMLTGGTLGMAFGGIIGTIGSFLPTILGALGVAGAASAALPTLGFIASTAAVCSIIGGGIGITLNTDVASNAASVSAGLEEMEKRHKVEQLQNGIGVQGTAPAKPGDAPSSATIAAGTKIISPRVGIITFSLFAIFGAVASFTPLASAAAMVGLTGMAGTIASACMMGMFGSLIGVKNSLLTNKVNNFYFKLITEQYFGPPKEKTTQPVLTPVREPRTQESYAIAATPDAALKNTHAATILAGRAQPTAAEPIR